MALDFSQIIVDKCAGKYNGWCCLSADQMIAVVAELRHADSDAEIVRFHQYICGCNQGGSSPNPGPSTCMPGTPGCNEKVAPPPAPCAGDACNCTEALKQACSDSGFRLKLYAAAAALTAALVPLGAAAANPVGLAALSTLKDYGDAVRSLAEICVTGSATKDDINDFCSQRAAALAVADKVPGGLGLKLLSPLESLLESINSACCSDYTKPVPIQEESGMVKKPGFSRPRFDLTTVDAKPKQYDPTIVTSEVEESCPACSCSGGFTESMGLMSMHIGSSRPIRAGLLKRIR